MKPVLPSLFVLPAILAFVACGRAEPAAVPPPAQPTSEPASPRFDRPAPIEASGTPTRAELFMLVSANADVPLSSGEYCEDVIGPDLTRDPVLGDWIAYNLSVLEDPPITLPAGCEDAGETWFCHVEFSADADGESPWRWGVRFSMNKSDRRPVPDSLICSGAG